MHCEIARSSYYMDIGDIDSIINYTVYLRGNNTPAHTNTLDILLSWGIKSQKKHPLLCPNLITDGEYKRKERKQETNATYVQNQDASIVMR